MHTPCVNCLLLWQMYLLTDFTLGADSEYGTYKIAFIYTVSYTPVILNYLFTVDVCISSFVPLMIFLRILGKHVNCLVKKYCKGVIRVLQPEPEFLNVYGAQESIPRIRCSMAGRYDSPLRCNGTRGYIDWRNRSLGSLTGYKFGLCAWPKKRSVRA
jgi:hypothetical protein